jgi:Na+/citrate or Na+/malate symporter
MDESKDDVVAEESRPGSDKDYSKLGAGLLISVTFMVAGSLISVIVPQIHGLAWTILIAIIAKASGIISDEFCDYANFWFNFMLRNLLPVLIAGIGITSFDVTILGKYFTLGAFFVIIMGITGAFIGAMIFGRMFKLWPLEAGITAALCSCDVGGSGDIAILSASNRMQLLPFSSISTRIGGALMILEIGLLMPLFLK